MNNNSVMYSTGTFAGVIDAQVRAYFNHAKEEQSSDLYYKQLGLVDYEPDVPEEKLKDISGPGKGVLTVEGQQYGAVSMVEGYDVTLTLRKYTFDLAYTEEDIHWIRKQSSSKRQSTLRDAGSEAVQSLYQNINEDTAKVFYLGAGTTFMSVGRPIIADIKSLLIIGEPLTVKLRAIRGKLSQIKDLLQPQRLSEENALMV